MNQRLQTKCLFASAAMHALLFVIILVAPAFLPEKPRPHTPVLNLVSARDLDAILRAAEAPPAPAPIPSPAPAPAPTAPAPVPAAPALVEPAPAPKVVEPPRPPPPTPKQVEPPKVVVKATPPPTPKAPKDLPKRETVKEPAPKTAKVEPRPLPVTAKGKEAPAKKDARKSKEPEPPPTKTTSGKSTATKPAIKLADTSHLTSRHAEEDAKAKQKADAEERAQSVAAARAAQQVHLAHVAKMKAILGGVQGGLSSPVDINIDAGGGPNAAAFLDYGQMMVRIYEQMWLVPPNLSDSLAIVGVTVTVARNGRVLEWQLPKPSGNSAIDKSVRETLQKVIQFEPFPASFREAQRTFNIDFNLKAKRTTG